MNALFNALYFRNERAEQLWVSVVRCGCYFAE